MRKKNTKITQLETHRYHFSIMVSYGTKVAAQIHPLEDYKDLLLCGNQSKEGINKESEHREIIQMSDLHCVQ